MRELLRLYVKGIIWFVRWGIVVWFVLLPCLMLFNFFKPWHEAHEALRAEGFNGIPLQFGAGSAYSSSGSTWQKTQQRSYIVVPDSFLSMEVLTYEVAETNMSPPQARVMRAQILPLLLILYVGAGIHTFFVFRRLLRRRRAKLAEES